MLLLHPPPTHPHFLPYPVWIFLTVSLSPPFRLISALFSGFAHPFAPPRFCANTGALSPSPEGYVFPLARRCLVIPHSPSPLFVDPLPYEQLIVFTQDPSNF